MSIRCCNVLLEIDTYRVPEERRAPPSENTTETFSTANFTPRLEIAPIHLRVDLAAAFYQIQRSHSRVCYTLAFI